jgi:hypothetical protein
MREAVRVPRDPEQIKREIEEIRADLSTTVDQLSRRAAPRALAADAVSATTVWFGFAPPPAHLNGSGPQPAQIRWDRVGAVAGVVTLLVIRRVRKRRR